MAGEMLFWAKRESLSEEVKCKLRLMIRCDREGNPVNFQSYS